MDTNADKLKATIADLEQELRSLKTVDDDSRRALEDALGSIVAALREDRRWEVERRPLVERLKAAIERFEGSHPTLTLTVSRLVDGLAELGI